MKKKLIIALLALLSVVCLAFGLAACNGGNNSDGGNTNTQPHTHNYVYACSQTEHWQKCTGCEDEKEHSPHSVENGVCPICGYVERCTQGLEFKEIKQNEKIVGYEVTKGTATDSDIYIPSFYNNLPIYIGYEAFVYCTSLTSITIGNGVTSIGNYAFVYCTSLTSVTIPDSVTSIGLDAFRGCANLTGIYITDLKAWCNIEFISSPLYYAHNLYLNNELVSEITADMLQGVTKIKYSAFHNCSSLTSIEIPNSVTSIGAGAFLNCTSLTSINIPDGVTSIGESAFSGCTSLTSISIPNGVTSIGSSAFYNTAYYNNTDNWINEVLYINNHLIDAKTTLPGKYDIRQGTKIIADDAFYNCTSLESVTIPNGVTSIGESAFSGCTSLESVTIPDSVTSIGAGAFFNCTSLTSITIGNGVTSIGDSAFYKCTSLVSVNFGNDSKLETIGGSAFYDCTSLTSISIPDGVTSIGDRAFYKCTSLESITIPNSVTSIGIWAFDGCTNLTSITIGNGVTSIGIWAFDGCTNLTSVYITDIVAWCNIEFGDNPLYYAHNLYLNNELVSEITADMLQGVTKIKYSAFHNCSSLTSIEIPNSVTSIGAGAFLNCTSLTSINIPDSVTSIGSYAFRDCTSLESITVDENNPAYSSQDGILYNKDKTEIIKVPEAKTSVTIPNGVTSIGNSAFRGCTSLTSITIPDSVTSIGGYAFYYCESLTSVKFENTTGWKVSEYSDMSSAKDVNVTDDAAQNAELLKSTYCYYYWHRYDA